MFRIIIFLLVCTIALQNSSSAQNIQNSVWKSYGEDPINDTITLAIGKDSMVAANSQNMVLVKSAIHISHDTLTINDVEGKVKCLPDESGVYNYQISSNKMVWHVIHDPCDGRSGFANERVWIMVNKK